MAIVTDRQVRCLRTLLKSGKPLKVAAMRVDMDRKTAREYRNLARLPSELEEWPRAWRTREDPFADVWEEVREKLELSPGLQGKDGDPLRKGGKDGDPLRKGGERRRPPSQGGEKSATKSG